MTVSYDTSLRTNGNNTGIEVPAEVLDELGGGKRPRVTVRANDYVFSSSVGSMGGAAMISFSKAHREASGLVGGQALRVTLDLDTATAEIVVPPQLETALADAGRVAAFDRLAPSRRKEAVRLVTEAKSDDTRTRRIAKIVADLA